MRGGERQGQLAEGTPLYVLLGGFVMVRVRVTTFKVVFEFDSFFLYPFQKEKWT